MNKGNITVNNRILSNCGGIRADCNSHREEDLYGLGSDGGYQYHTEFAGDRTVLYLVFDHG